MGDDIVDEMLDGYRRSRILVDGIYRNLTDHRLYKVSVVSVSRYVPADSSNPDYINTELQHRLVPVIPQKGEEDWRVLDPVSEEALNLRWVQKWTWKS